MTKEFKARVVKLLSDALNRSECPNLYTMEMTRKDCVHSIDVLSKTCDMARRMGKGLGLDRSLTTLKEVTEDRLITLSLCVALEGGSDDPVAEVVELGPEGIWTSNGFEVVDLP